MAPNGERIIVTSKHPLLLLRLLGLLGVVVLLQSTPIAKAQSNGKQVVTISAGHSTARNVVFSPDGRWLASGGYDSAIKLWDIRSGRLLRTLTGHTDSNSQLQITPDGERIISASDDGSVRVIGPHRVVRWQC